MRARSHATSEASRINQFLAPSIFSNKIAIYLLKSTLRTARVSKAFWLLYFYGEKREKREKRERGEGRGEGEERGERREREKRREKREERREKRVCK